MKAPPNKTVRDVPGAQPYLQTSASSSNLNTHQRTIHSGGISSGVSLSNLGASKADKASKPSSFSTFIKSFSRSTGTGATAKESGASCLKTNNSATVHGVMVNGSLGLNGSTNNTILHSSNNNSHNNNCVVSTASLGSTPSPEKPANNFL